MIDEAYRDALIAVIYNLHGCKASWIESVPILETFQGKTAWEGVVEAFKLEGHLKAIKAYAWAFDKDGKPEYITVLEIPPVDSARKAVQAYVVSVVKGFSKS